MSSEDTPKVWAGDLACYNAGILHGEWIEITESMDKEDLQERINAVLASGTEIMRKDYPEESPHEEWMFNDVEFLPGIEQHSDLDSILEVAEAVHRHGISLIQAARACDVPLDEIEDRFCGTFANEIDYAYHIIEEIYGDPEKFMPKGLEHYFDYESYLHDMQCNGEIYSHHVDGEYYIFRSC